MVDLLYKRDKSSEDIENLLQIHKNLVYHMLTIAGQLNNPDAESAAWEGLWDSIVLFDIYSKTAFSTFACTVIKNAINTVLRKQSQESRYYCPITEALLIDCHEEEPECTETITYIDTQFKLFIDTRSGLVKSILLVWHSSGFIATPSNIATICKTSPSYVCRVQSIFRAFISGKLKEL